MEKNILMDSKFKAKPHILGNGFEPFEAFETFEINVPTFPVDCLPPVLINFSNAVSENKQVTVDMAAVAALAVIALCVQGKFVINPKPDWIEPLNIYTTIVAPPSDRKSPTLNEITAYLHEYTMTENKRLAPDISEYQIKKSILQKHILYITEQASKDKVSADDGAPRMREEAA